MNYKNYFIALIATIFMAACNAPTEQQEQTAKAEPAATAHVEFKDFGPEPFVFDIEAYTIQNETYRTSIWTGNYMQMTVMSIPAGGDIGLEMHPHVDQFLRVEAGEGLAMMGESSENLHYRHRVTDGSAILIPAGTWHNIINTGSTPLKMYSIYAPPQHPRGTIHVTKPEEGSH